MFLFDLIGKGITLVFLTFCVLIWSRQILENRNRFIKDDVVTSVGITLVFLAIWSIYAIITTL